MTDHDLAQAAVDAADVAVGKLPCGSRFERDRWRTVTRVALTAARPPLEAAAMAAERERCAALAAGQAEDYERSFGVADGPETLGRLEAAHDALVSLAALLREGQAPHV